MVLDQALLDSALKGMSRKGRTFLINYLRGSRLTQRQAIEAKCYDCDGMGESGDCDITSCAIFPFSPYAPAAHSTEKVSKKTGMDTQNEYLSPGSVIPRGASANKAILTEGVHA